MGPFPDRLRCSIFTDYMTKKYGYDWRGEQSKFENFLEKLEDFIQTCYTPINYFLDKREQKIKVHIDRWDTWGMDHTLAHIIVPMLIQLKETKHGAPCVDLEDCPLHLWPENGDEWYKKYSTNGETDPYFFKRWDWVLDEMIWTFEQKTKDNWEDQYYVWEGTKLIHSNDDARKKHQDRITNGLRLFGKYYESLWD